MKMNLSKSFKNPYIIYLDRAILLSSDFWHNVYNSSTFLVLFTSNNKNLPFDNTREREIHVIVGYVKWRKENPEPAVEFVLMQDEIQRAQQKKKPTESISGSYTNSPIKNYVVTYY